MNVNKALWETLDISILEREYSPSSCVPNYEELVARYTSESEIIEDQINITKDLIYDPSSGECLDLSTTGDASAPICVFFHGGYWQLLSKNDALFPAKTFNDNGIAFSAVDYTLAPAASLGEMIEQCRRSIQWIYNNASQYGYDADQIYVAGSSAGAHLASMVILTDWTEYNLPLDIIKGGTLLSGIYDVRPIVETYINEPLKLNLKDAKDLSPLFKVKENKTQLIVTWGENETTEFKRQSIEFENKWKEIGNRSTLLEVQHANHFDILFYMLDKDCSLRSLIMRQILGDKE